MLYLCAGGPQTAKILEVEKSLASAIREHKRTSQSSASRLSKEAKHNLQLRKKEKNLARLEMMMGGDLEGLSTEDPDEAAQYKLRMQAVERMKLAFNGMMIRRTAKSTSIYGGSINGLPERTKVVIWLIMKENEATAFQEHVNKVRETV